MISFKVKVSRFKKQTINLPTSWSELTLEQWNKIKSLDESQTNEIFKILIDSDLNVNVVIEELTVFSNVVIERFGVVIGRLTLFCSLNVDIERLILF
jgi:hypothetical protein